MRIVIAMSLACCVLAGCGRSDGKAPGGQVVATVDGQEITAAELNLELGSYATTGALDPAARKAVIDALIARKLLVAEAKARQLDKLPDTMMARQRARDLTLVGLLKQDFAGAAARPPSDADLDRYIAAHPDVFARRELVTVDQLVIQGADATMAAQMRSQPSLDAANSYLAAKAIPSARSTVVVDTLFLDPGVAADVWRAPLNGLVVAPGDGGGALRVMQIKDRQPAGLLGGESRSAARALLARDADDRVRARLQQVVRDGQKQVTTAPALAAN